MHELFAEVLAKKDLSKAGELFSLSDDVIERDLVEILEKIKEIADTEDYSSNSNDQSVVEICITRVTTAIRETERIENHAESLVDLLNMCLRHDLSQVVKDEDPPHAKIASDVMSRLFMHYSNRVVMELSIPVVVKFLDCDNKDLVRSVASYLSLAAIENASMLAKHMQLILLCVLRGNHDLGQLLPQIYSQNPEPVNDNVNKLINMMQERDPSELAWLIVLFGMLARHNAQLLEKHVSELCKYLTFTSLAIMVLMTLKDIAMACPKSVAEHMETIKAASDSQTPYTYQLIHIAGAVGTVSQEEGAKSMDYLVSQLCSSDVSLTPVILQEMRGLGQLYPELLKDNLQHVVKLTSSTSSAVRLGAEQIREDCSKFSKIPEKTTGACRNTVVTANKENDMKTDKKSSEIQSKEEQPMKKAKEQDCESSEIEEKTEEKEKEVRSVSSQTEGTVTVITVGSPPNSAHPSGTVSVKNAFSQSQATNSVRHTETRSSAALVDASSQSDSYSQHQLEPIRDGVQLFCEKHLAKIKSFINKLNVTVPLPVKCTVVSDKHKRYLKLHFECARQSDQCLYNGSHFTLKSHLHKIWLHVMFLSVQAKSDYALSQRNSDVSSLKSCWDALKGETFSSFLTLVTSSFPTQKDQLSLIQELHEMRYFDVFELNAAQAHWACFMCNHPEKISKLMTDGIPEMAGQLKEKKGKWKFFKRWKTRYFTLSGGSFTYDKSNSTKATLPVTKIQSVKAVRKGIRDIPKAFEIFTGDQTYVFKAKDNDNVEQWVQCLHIAVARSHTTGASGRVTSQHPVPRSRVGADSGHFDAPSLDTSIERECANTKL